MSPRPQTVLVTAVGGVIGCGIVRSLRMSGRVSRILGADIYPDAMGKHWCDEFLQILPAANMGYFDDLCDHLDRYDVDLVIPGTEEEVLALHDNRSRKVPSGTQIVLNTPEVIDCARDKWKAFEAFQAAGIPTPASSIASDFHTVAEELKIPMLGKLRSSHSGRGMREVHGEDEFVRFREAAGKEGSLFQQIVGNEDEEYTVSVFGFGDGTASVGPLLKRRLARDGSTSQAVTVTEPELVAMVELATQCLRPLGPTNYQYRRHDGEFLLLEVNPRISSATSIRCAFGFNEAAMCVEFFLDGRRPRAESIRQGSAFRYMADEIRYRDEEGL